MKPILEQVRDGIAKAIYAGGDEPEWLTTEDGSPNAASYEHADRVLAVIDELLMKAIWKAEYDALHDAARAEDLDLGHATKAARRWLDARADALAR